MKGTVIIVKAEFLRNDVDEPENKLRDRIDDFMRGLSQPFSTDDREDRVYEGMEYTVMRIS